MSEGEVTCQVERSIARVVFDRPAARNAMTKKMYGQLQNICERLAKNADVRAAVFRGAGGKSFVAGSDVGIFDGFESAQDGLDYEAEMEGHTRALAGLPMPTIAVIEGWAVGGGLNLASACDLRIGTPDARMGAPLARTMGNCLSIFNYARLISGFGAPRAKRMLLLGEFVGAAEAQACGFLTEVASPEDIDTCVSQMCARILEQAPITMRVSKYAIDRVQRIGLESEAVDLLTQAYGSQDFKIGVAAFQEGTPPKWTGR